MSDEEELKKQIKSAWGYMEDTLGDFGFDPAKSVFSEFDLSMSPLSIIGNAALKGLRPNILSKSRKFPAIVLLPFQAPHSDVAGAHEPAGSSEKVQACKAFVPTLHAACLNPFSVTDTILRAALISSFPTFYAETDALEPLVPGSLIEVSFDNKYDNWSSGIIKEIILARPVDMPDWAVDVPGATDLFNNWPSVVGRGITMMRNIFTGPDTQACSEWRTADQILAAYPHIDTALSKKIEEVALRLRMDPGWLANAINYESRFDPSIRNKKGSGATGLIQFMGFTAKRLGTTTDALAKMGAVEQMDWVEKYFEPHAGKLNSQSDIYAAIFFPLAVGSGPGFDIYNHYLVNEGQAKADIFLSQNGGIRTMGDYTNNANKNAKLFC